MCGPVQWGHTGDICEMLDLLGHANKHPSGHASKCL